MEVTGTVIALVSLLIVISVLSSSISPRLGIPVLLLYLFVGMLAGEDGLLGIQYSDVTSAHLIGSASLAVILFDGGLRTNRRAFRVALSPALGLATVGVIITAAITAAVAMQVLGIGWIEAMLLGAIVGSTDAAAVFSLLHGRGMALKERVASTLEIESGANDPMAVFLTIVMVEALVSGVTPGWLALPYFLWQMAAGAAVGVLSGMALAAMVTRITLNAGLYPLLVLFGALFSFGLASMFEASGFLAVYLAGLTMSSRVSRGLYNIQRFLDGAAWLSQITMFLMLGMLVTPMDLLPHAGSALLIGLALIFIARPAAVMVCLLPFRFAWREQVFVAWVGLRGAVPIILALFPWMAGLENWQTYFNLAFFVVLVSLLLQGWTIAPLARLLKLEVPSRSGRMQRIELGMPGQEEYELVGYSIEADSPLIDRSPLDLQWPGDARPMVAIRQGKVLQLDQVDALTMGDQIYLLARPTELEKLDRRIVGEREPERLGERQFFGEFVIAPSATVGELSTMYGFSADDAVAGLTISEYISRRYPHPVVGDRVELDPVQFVVRETDGDTITKVGLKLSAG
ncbi:MAG: potassium/proton antiporter [Gammaproteobacteria bacterium]|nr:potassium/proton antiporter [Gammaproteobacteria bacterium]